MCFSEWLNENVTFLWNKLSFKLLLNELMKLMDWLLHLIHRFSLSKQGFWQIFQIHPVFYECSCFLFLQMYANFVKHLTNEFDSPPKKNKKWRRRQLSSCNINEPCIHLSTERSKQGPSFVYVISPPAHGDRNVSQTLWLTKDRSTPRSQGNWSIVGNGFPVAILNTPGHLPPCVVFS